MEGRAAKLALARKKLKDHQNKKQVTVHKSELSDIHLESLNESVLHNESVPHNENDNTVIEYHQNSENSNSPPTIHEREYESNPVEFEPPKMEINVTEMLISNKRNLEMQIVELQSKLLELDSQIRVEVMAHNDSKNELKDLQIELLNLKDNYKIVTEQLLQINQKCEEMSTERSSLIDSNNNLLEQLEFTKTVLTAKETENTSLYSQLNQLQSELNVSQLQIQQLINGSNAYATQVDSQGPNQSDLLQKVDNLEQQLKSVQKERDQISTHYEHYVAELNEHMKSMMLRNEDLSKQVNDLCNRESSLIDQISEMEIRLQNLQMRRMESDKLIDRDSHFTLIQNEHQELQDQYKEVSQKYQELQKQILERENTIMELKNAAKEVCCHDNISVAKLTADIASDKVAAQRATEQNKILKTSMHELEEAFVKMSQDKLDLTEKITAEKFLNRELTIKLAESEENYRDLQVKLRAKDKEMIRLQASYRDVELEIEKLNDTSHLIHEHSVEADENEDKTTTEQTVSCDDQSNHHTHDCPKSILNVPSNHKNGIPKDDAMIKLQERFLKIMDEVADLSDEKHRLEHIILQLQTETDTICEYVALYQQQRSLLKKRDEERSSQIKFFQTECDKLQRQLEELSGILLRFSQDAELSTYFQDELKQRDMEKVRSLLLNLKSNTLIDPRRNELELNNIYPCHCCSGNLIDV